MPKFGKWILTLGLVAATPLAAGAANPLANLFNTRGSQQNGGARSNQEVANEIAQALRAAQLNRYKLDISFANGVCTISGQIASITEKARVSRTIAGVKGVLRIDNRLLVAGQQSQSPARGVRTADYVASAQRGQSGLQRAGYQAPAEEPAEQPAAAAPSNQQVAEAIGQALKGAGLTGYDMEIQYRNGIAALGGTVSSSLQRAQAEEVVRRVAGVKMVNNQLRVAAGQTEPTAAQPRQMPRQIPQQAQVPQGYPVQRAAAMYSQPPVAMPGYQHAGPGAAHTVYNNANLPEYAWPSYAAYPNYAQLTYPKQYSASAWPYIGPFYPYPQVPLGWRKATLEWDDGYWALNFNSRTDRWWWFLNPRNWRSNPN